MHISRPYDTFIKMILRKIKPEQIFSLCLHTEERWSEAKLSSLAVFTNVSSLTLLNHQAIEQISQYEKYFPGLTCLSLWYDNEFSSNT